MRAGIFWSVSMVAGLAVAQPHKRHNHHKRDVETVTDITYVTTTAPEVMVIVDPNGNPVMTSTLGQPAYTPALSIPSSSTFVVVSTPTSTPVASSVPASSATSETSAPASTSAAPASSSAAPAPPSEAAASSASPTTVSSAVSTASEIIGASPTVSTSQKINAGFGISYSPYDSSGGCKDQSAVSSDIAQLTGYDYVRLYGSDCNQTATVLTAAKAQGMKVFAAIYDLPLVSTEIQTLIEGVNGDWSSIHTVAIGNENVDTGSASVAAVSSAVGTARSALTAAGYTGPVVHVDTYAAYYNNPDLCSTTDYVAANCHPFFAGVDASDAGNYVAEQVQKLAQTCGNSDVVITETGWPTGGSQYEAAIPSVENQKIAFQGLRTNFTSNLVLFSAFDDDWKVNTASTYGTEQHWGFVDNGA